jgi:pyruvate, orthophosphate dikinase
LNSPVYGLPVGWAYVRPLGTHAISDFKPDATSFSTTPIWALALPDGPGAHTRFAEPLPAPLARATVAGIGVACGRVALDVAWAGRLAAVGTPPILVRPETVTEDIFGLAQAAGILTAAGNRTAHAAVVARQPGKVCLVGCGELTFDLARRACRIGAQVVTEGDMISLDGNLGAIYPGLLPIVTLRPERELAIVAGWRGARDA